MLIKINYLLKILYKINDKIEYFLLENMICKFAVELLKHRMNRDVSLVFHSPFGENDIVLFSRSEFADLTFNEKNVLP